MPDMNRTSASASAALQENAVSHPTKTRWLVLLLISFMYLGYPTGAPGAKETPRPQVTYLDA